MASAASARTRSRSPLLPTRERAVGKVFIKTPTGKCIPMVIEASDTLESVSEHIKMIEGMRQFYQPTLALAIENDGRTLVDRDLLGQTFYLMPEYVEDVLLPIET